MKGFVFSYLGMRGKKAHSDILSELQYLESLNDYDTDFNDNLQNERRFIDEIIRQYDGADISRPNRQTDSDGGGGYKRAPSAGFFGMRGKRYGVSDNDDNSDDMLEKRAPSNGFFGMRGKKWSDDSIDSDEFDLGEEKRAPSVGFHGNYFLYYAVYQLHDLSYSFRYER